MINHRYSESGTWAERFASLARKDKTFAEFLAYKLIDVKDLNPSDRDRNGTLIRKMAPFVAVREYFRKDPSLGAATLRSRKSNVIYAGADSYFLISEGNPRWLIGMTQSLLAKQEVPVVTISAADQVSEIDAATERFRAMLETVPLPASSHALLKGGLIGLLDAIGKGFFQKNVVDDFQAEPPTTFIVDSDIETSIEHALQTAINVGAIIYLPENSSKFLVSSVRGKRFRLSYMLSPVYHLPLRSSRHVLLSNLLNESNRPSSSDQMPLLGEY